MTIIKPVNRLTKEEFDYVVSVAKADGHGTLGVTHVVEKDQQPIGHLSVAGMPLVLFWMHTKNAQIRDCLRVMDFYENSLRDKGCTGVVVPCAKSSPLLGYMEKLGYTKSELDFNLFIKGL